MSDELKRLRRRCIELKSEADALRDERNSLRRIFVSLEQRKHSYTQGAPYSLILGLLSKAKEIPRA